jgi:hypothetical protein
MAAYTIRAGKNNSVAASSMIFNVHSIARRTMVRGNRKGSPGVAGGGRVSGAALHPELVRASRGGFG